MIEQLVIFDLDGTLIDSRADLTTAVNLMRRDNGLPPLTVDTITGFVGNGIHKLVERALRDGQADIDAAVECVRKHYMAHMLDETVLYPGTRAALTGLAGRGCTMALVTNKPQAPAEAICRALGVDRFLSVILGGDACPNIKPHPEPLHLAMRRTGAGRAGTWMVGDNCTDLAAARNAGVAACFCNYGFGRLDGETYDLAVDSLPEFAAYLETHSP